MHPVVGGAVIWVQVQGNVQEVASELNRMIGTDKWEIKFSKVKKKRSLDANAYCWKLVDSLAEVLHESPKEVYREAIRDIGGVSDILCIKNEAVETFVTNWESRGIGWQTETFPSKLEGCTNVRVFYGSSTYDTKQMSTLIDRLIEECKAQGIPTLTPKEIAELEGVK